MSESPPKTTEDARRYLGVSRAAIRYRSEATGRRHFCHNKEYRSAFLTRIIQLRAFIKVRGEPK